ncbi:cilia- and flagella-associated protein 58-like [Perca flavescens]|uniref:cilia- and flagella-associated protein 58-like n=1 Tax=Perca flavescens TaxID=8167 RepID=UPI00106E74E4|nr:cilia- and flagella-associated protein 58-like [Perca flavescens]
MEATNMADNISPAASEKLLTYLINELGKMKSVADENHLLRRQVNIYKLNEKSHMALKEEVIELRKQLNLKREFCKSWKKDQKLFLEREDQLIQLTKEKDFLIKQQLPYKQCTQSRRKNEDQEYTLRCQKTKTSHKIHCLELEVEKHRQQILKLKTENGKLQVEKKQLQEEKSKLFKNNTDIQHKKSELEEAMRHLKKEKNKLQDEKSVILRRESTQREKLSVMDKMYSDLEKQLEQIVTDLDKNSPNISINVSMDKPLAIAKMQEKNRKLNETLITTRKKLERKDCIISEKEKKYEKLKRRMSELLPPEKLELLQKCQFVTRDLGKKVKALMGQFNMFQAIVEEYKNENGKLFDKVANITKSYLIEKKRTCDLCEALKASGIKVPEHKPSAFQVPVSPNVLRMQSREKQVHTKMQTLKATPACLPPISQKPLLEPGIKSFALGASTISKKRIFNSKANLDLPITNKTDESHKKFPYIKFPPISSNSLQRKIFMTETSCPNNN